jgi:hypothetical protein
MISHEGAREIPIKGFYRDYGFFAGSGVSCVSPPDCEVYIPSGYNFTGTMTGDALGTAHGNVKGWDPSKPDRYSGWKSPISFIGTIEGCGTGSLNFAVQYRFQAPDANGLPANETGQFIPGSASTGLASVADIQWAITDFKGYPMSVPMHGTAWCR